MCFSYRYTYIYMYTHVSMYVYLCVYTRVCEYVYVRVARVCCCVCVCVHVCVREIEYVCVFVCVGNDICIPLTHVQPSFHSILYNKEHTVLKSPIIKNQHIPQNPKACCLDTNAQG